MCDSQEPEPTGLSERPTGERIQGDPLPLPGLAYPEWMGPEAWLSSSEPSNMCEDYATSDRLFNPYSPLRQRAREAVPGSVRNIEVVSNL